ncbi:MAG: cytosine permease [Candidatus Dormibacteraeota bacterium]|uniref:Cytosine permease n=1 Tax=Candidatus Aeolococcus gillhamiae TaxID=3127015 RepID=A0A934K205_9BACT|nr:cytosine permease [Candidatus Dormibacteraeota bacterium]
MRRDFEPRSTVRCRPARHPDGTAVSTTVTEEVEAGVLVREGVYGDSVAAIEPGGVEYIPAAERHGRPIELFWTWMSPNFEFATVYVGVLPVVLFGGGFWLTVLGLVLGTALGSVTHGWLSTFGPRYGVPQLIQSRGAFGFVGNLLPAALNTLTSGAGWVAVNSVSGAFAVQTFFGHVGWRVPPFWLALAVVVSVEVAIAFVGYNMVHRFERVIFPFLGLVFAACCLYIFGHTNAQLGFNAAAPAAAGGQVGAFILAVFFAYAYAVSWNPYGADYARYLPRNTPALRVALAAGLGIFVSCALLEIAGAALATVAGTSWGPNDVPTDQFVKPLPDALGLIATVAIALGAVAANVLNLYSAAMSFLTLGIRLTLRRRRAIVAVAFGIVGFGVGLTGGAAPGSKYEAFLFFNTYWIVPFIAVVLTDWTVRRGRYREAGFFDPRHRPWKGVVAMVAGIAASFPFWNQTLFVGVVPSNAPQVGDISFVVGCVVAVITYLALRPRATAPSAPVPPAIAAPRPPSR